MKLDSRWHSCEESSLTNDYLVQYDTSYYQNQPADYNQRQNYHHDRTTQQAPYRTGYAR